MSKVEYAPKPEAVPILNFYMGKNTPERKDYIMERLVVLMGDRFDWGGNCDGKTQLSIRIEGGGQSAPTLPMACAAVRRIAACRESLRRRKKGRKFLVTSLPPSLRKRVL
ncbi:MAG: hypothetical protein KJ070_25315 [Verrucomicrobia bacterium]|nr:hypothetical protein [Verrucomicrobiota bacterium]